MSSSPTLHSRLFIPVAGLVLAASALILAAFGYPTLVSPAGKLLVARVEARLLPHDVAAANAVTRNWLEVGEDEKAVAAAQRTLQRNPGNTEAIELLGASYAAAGDRAELTALTASVTRSEARSAVLALGQSKLAQAQELYLLGLVRSSQRALEDGDDGSAQYAILRAKVELSLQPGAAGDRAAMPLAALAVERDPSSKVAHDLYISVSRKN